MTDNQSLDQKQAYWEQLNFKLHVKKVTYNLLFHKTFHYFIVLSHCLYLSVSKQYMKRIWSQLFPLFISFQDFSIVKQVQKREYSSLHEQQLLNISVVPFGVSMYILNSGFVL